MRHESQETAKSLTADVTLATLGIYGLGVML